MELMLPPPVLLGIPFHRPLPLPVAGSLPTAQPCFLIPVPVPRCSGGVFYGILGPPPLQPYCVRSCPSGLSILGPPPQQPAPADLQEDGAASPPPLDIELVVSWRPPPDGWVKLNTDGSFVGKDSSGGARFVARDS